MIISARNVPLNSYAIIQKKKKTDGINGKIDVKL